MRGPVELLTLNTNSCQQTSLYVPATDSDAGTRAEPALAHPLQKTSYAKQDPNPDVAQTKASKLKVH